MCLLDIAYSMYKNSFICLWDVESMKQCVYEIVCLWNSVSMKYFVYEIVCLKNILSLKLYIYKMCLLNIVCTNISLVCLWNCCV